MNIDNLEILYKNLKTLEDPFDTIFDFKEELLSSDCLDYLEFHYKIIQDPDLSEEAKSTIKFFFVADALNKRNKEKVGEFLYEKYIQGIEDTGLRADVIQLLSNLKSKYAKKVALENLTIRQGDLRYRSIIVLGWVGNQKDLSALNDRLLTDPDGQLRCYAATAMRQIWFNHPKTKDEILHYLKNAISKEEDKNALEGIIITAQELLKKKLGLKESKYGDVTGNYQAAQLKTINALKSY
ncbi:MAG TPA: HEAT repeat domain-containing protein [Pseudoxanthomonas sp.]|nr:HEAT repeat domain-containing protein [Pseudoxanthomonas sp.]